MIVDKNLTTKIIGTYNINGIQLATSNKPNIIRRILIYLILGWKWNKINNKK